MKQFYSNVPLLAALNPRHICKRKAQNALAWDRICDLPPGLWDHKSPGLQLILFKICFVLSGIWMIPSWMKETSLWIKRSIRGKIRVIYMSNPTLRAVFCGPSYLLLQKVWGICESASGLPPPGLVGHVREWVIRTKQVQGSARTWMGGWRNCRLRGRCRAWLF